jgi:hypothetical protein
VRRSLDAGRPARSANNRRPWRFLVLGHRGRVDRVAQSVYVSPDVRGAPRVIAIVVSGKFLRRPAGGPEHHAGRVERGPRPLSERNREPRRGWAELLGLKVDEQGIRNGYRRLSGAGGGPRSAPIRGVSAAAVREAASLLESLGHQVQESAIEVEEGSPTTSAGSGSPRRATRSTGKSGSAGAGSRSTSSTRGAARCTELSS